MGNVKCQSTCHVILDPSSTDEIYKDNASIGSQLLFQFTQLTWINEIVGYQLELKSIADNFFNKFSYSIKKNNRSKGFRKII